MNIIGKLLFVGAGLAILAAVGVGCLWYNLSQHGPVPELQLQYWGPGASKPDDKSIKEFKIKVSNQSLDNLHNRLKFMTLTRPVEDTNSLYGFNTDYMKKIVEFWLHKYDWRKRETYLNSLPQFKTQVGGLQIHFIHAKPSAVPAGTTVLPLLLLHGWPGSVREFYELTPLLTTPRPGAGFVFEVVAPSLPGFGFSEGASKQGLGPAHVAVLMRALMLRLGHGRFYVHGGDWGHLIGSAMGTLYPENVLGFHTHMLVPSSLLSVLKFSVGTLFPSTVAEPEQYGWIAPFRKLLKLFSEDFAYLHMQATSPDTIGISLRDSPVGMAAYILEKFSSWNNKNWRSLPDGGLEEKCSLTDLLDNVMIYWFSGSITTSVRLYKDAASSLTLQVSSLPCIVPTAIASFPHEVVYVPPKLANDKFTDVIQVTYMPRGGHFAALEEPKLVADDLWAAVYKMKDTKRQHGS